MFRAIILILISTLFWSCEMTGCKDEKACNYSSNALGDDGSCWSPQDDCDCSYGPNGYRTESYWSSYVCDQDCWEECYYWDYDYYDGWYEWVCVSYYTWCNDIYCDELVEGYCVEG